MEHRYPSIERDTPQFLDCTWTATHIVQEVDKPSGSYRCKYPYCMCRSMCRDFHHYKAFHLQQGCSCIDQSRCHILRLQSTLLGDRRQPHFHLYMCCFDRSHSKYKHYCHHKGPLLEAYPKNRFQWQDHTHQHLYKGLQLDKPRNSNQRILPSHRCPSGYTNCRRHKRFHQSPQGVRTAHRYTHRWYNYCHHRYMESG